MRPSVEYIKQLGSAPYDICQVFARLGSFHSEEHGFPSYRSVQGEGVRDIPDHTPLSQRTWPVYNESRRDLADAVLAAERLGRKFFQPDKKDQFGVLSRDYMIEGSTLPIRVTYTHDVPQGRKRAPRHQIHSLFIKEMNLNRVFLSRLYHLATGQPDPLMFSESSIVEPEIHGQTLQQYYATNKDYWKDSRN
ncbi:MAG TPA: hypothetical protein VJI15_01255, partial [Candidatus Nanoarchaeia archaeon]|nr:hypothetical protein [Candidatus Nanoarchaeia archaeon]